MNAPADARPAPSRPDQLHRRNERIAAAARRHRFEADVPVPFLCECSSHECRELVRITLVTYDDSRGCADYLTAPGHQVDDTKIVRTRESVWLYRRVADALVP